MMEVVGAIGILVGPAIGSGFYTFVGYLGTFLLYAGLLLIFVIFVAIYNKREHNYEPADHKVEISLCRVACNLRILTVLVYVIFGMAGPVYLEAVAANWLHGFGLAPG
jgi:hypothetical protein